jgi:hypothetical protein
MFLICHAYKCPVNKQVLQLVGPRVEPVAAGLRHAAAQRTQLLRAARR